MKPSRLFSALLPLLFPVLLSSLSLKPNPETGIKATLNAQVEAWNRRDVATFVSTYAEDCTFIGKQILQGRGQLLARYKRQYPTPDAMGNLMFHNLQVKPLDKRVAVVTGEWHLNRSSEGGGPVGGIFSLVLQFNHGVWRIVLDHTT